mgnify:FL=1
MPLTLESDKLTLSMDEMCLSVYEFVQPTPDYKAKHRYQTLRVIRKDRVVKFTWDMGDRSLYNRIGLYCATGLIHTKDGQAYPVPVKIPYSQIRSGGIVPLRRVGDALELADEMRADTALETSLVDPADLIGGYLMQLDEIAKWKTHRSVFGPFVAIVRS